MRTRKKRKMLKARWRTNLQSTHGKWERTRNTKDVERQTEYKFRLYARGDENAQETNKVEHPLAYKLLFWAMEIGTGKKNKHGRTPNGTTNYILGTGDVNPQAKQNGWKPNGVQI